MFQYTTISTTLLSDLTTPVSVFMKLRECYPELLLLESSDYSSKEDSKSFICFDPILTLSGFKGQYKLTNHLHHKTEDLGSCGAIEAVGKILAITAPKTQENPYNGVFGYTGFDVVQEFEGVTFNHDKPSDDFPSLRYDFFKHIIVFDHFFNQMTIIENVVNGYNSAQQKVLDIISRDDNHVYDFKLEGDEKANMNDDDFLRMVNKGKEHCQRGDVFQMVLSRRFSQGFSGDEFNVYRRLRSVNPSPYLFYFDYGSYRIFGSSPEAQMVVKEGVAEIHPIAGTFKRSGNYSTDQSLAQQLLDDPKENAEHIMLVDLARNDLSKNCLDVFVDKYKEIQFFSHVIHLVSKVKGTIKPGFDSYQIFADTFPAGTLSGAPKHKALQLIDNYEPTTRTFYGGGIGMIGHNGDLNHAIIIRTFLSYNGNLHFQAGAGIVIDSVDINELNEVRNKLGALRKALIV